MDTGDTAGSFISIIFLFKKDDFGVFTAIAGNGTTYANLFEVILSDEYKDYWVEKCAEAVGDEAADETAEMLRSYISRDIYGQEAIP